MAYIEWTSKLETGIDAIDKQHQQLIGFVNELYEAMHQGKGRLVVGDILSKLVRYTEYHFATEEKAFQKYGYSGQKDHEQIHRTLVEKVKDLERRQRTEAVVVSMETLRFLNEWVTNHIAKEDMAYVPFLKDKAIE